MNATQQQHYAKGLSRAADRGVEVVATGHTHDGRKVYLTTSGSDANKWHVVVVEGNTLTCDCKAAQNGRYCCHRSVASARIAEEQAEEVAHVAWYERTEAERDRWDYANMGGALIDAYRGW